MVQARPQTGRTHQLRVHLASQGMPIVGDSMYGDSPNEDGVARLALHAYSLSFTHPSQNKTATYRQALPADMAAAMGAMGDLSAIEHLL